MKFTDAIKSRTVRLKIGLKIAFGKRRTVAIVAGEKVLHAAILSEIDKVIGPNGLGAEFKLNDLVDRIVKLTRDTTNPSPTLRDRMNVETKGLTRQGFFRFAQVCGVVGLWELNLRIFAARLSVDVKRPEEDRGKRSAHLVDYADLSEVISALNPKIGALNAELFRLNRIRNMFVHGNFQATRELVIARLTKREQEQFKGQVIAMNLETGQVVNLAERMSKEQREAQDQFGWFLEVFATELFDSVFDLFQNSLLLFHDMILLRSLCFDNAEGAFEKLVGEGVALGGDILSCIFSHAKTVGVEEGHISHVVDRINRKIKIANP